MAPDPEKRRPNDPKLMSFQFFDFNDFEEKITDTSEKTLDVSRQKI